MPGLYLCDRDGSSCERLTDRMGSYPSWSPDGRFITLDLEDGIWLFPLSDDAPRRLANGSRPTWSSNSQQIAYMQYTNGAMIVVSNIDGSGYQQLAEGDYAAWQPLPRSHAP